MALNIRAKAEEEQIKEQLYDYLYLNAVMASEDADKARRYARSGAYEEDDAFIHHNEMKKQSNLAEDSHELYKNLRKKPYYAHVDLQDLNQDEKFTVLLTDSETLDHRIEFGNNQFVFPFIHGDDAAFRQAVYAHYFSKNSKPFVVNGYTYQFALIRDVTVENRRIEDGTQFLPIPDDEAPYSADELLSKKLGENRKNARLQNIISTLQQKQYDIVSKGVEESFIVQGCAGSGKTQCLLHRLFYLRRVLDKRGWDKVLFITPTQLFRNYSAELVRRFRLSEIKNYSIATLYCDLLSNYDERFKSRQYRIEVTEEYLPDEYLQQIYAPEELQRIEREITKAIQAHVSEACRLLNESVPAQVTAESIKTIEAKLDGKLKSLKETEEIIENDPAYSVHFKNLEQMEKAVEAKQKAVIRSTNIIEALERERTQFDELVLQADEADSYLEEWREEVKKEQETAAKKMNDALDAFDRSSPMGQDILLEYVQCLYSVIQLTDPACETRKERMAFESELLAAYDQAQSKLKSFTKAVTPTVWERRHSEKLAKAKQQLTNEKNGLDALNRDIQAERKWLEDEYLEIEATGKAARQHRDALEKAKYYLSRIESAVFEQEVWNALAPLKEKCGIQTLEITDLGNGHQRQDRILYKSDLLFYLKIYMQLHPFAKLPEFHMICVDEGQDLSSADYQTIRKLFPEAVLNVFGDISQVLHEDCGVHDWTAETGIRTIETMNVNYRNTAGITDFCNRNFGAEMQSVERPLTEEKPKRFSNAASLKQFLESRDDSVVIVKTRKEFEILCQELQLDRDMFEFLDTTAEKESSGRRCYTVFSAKGLEFTSAVVFSRNMTNNQKIVAFTRAMKDAYYYE